MEYPTERDLDGLYFRVERDGRWLNLCFSDLTESERLHVMENRSDEWLKRLAIMLADTIRGIGESLNIVGA